MCTILSFCTESAVRGEHDILSLVSVMHAQCTCYCTMCVYVCIMICLWGGRGSVVRTDC